MELSGSFHLQPLYFDVGSPLSGVRAKSRSHTMKRTVLLLALMVSSTAFAADELMQKAQGMFKPIPTTPPTLKGRVATPAEVELGKMLYFEPRLSQSHNISCNTCHLIGLGGVDMLPTSIGHKWQKGGRNAPTVLNAVFNVAQFWDGRAADLKAQAGGPIQNPQTISTKPT